MPPRSGTDMVIYALVGRCGEMGNDTRETGARLSGVFCSCGLGVSASAICNHYRVSATRRDDRVLGADFHDTEIDARLLCLGSSIFAVSVIGRATSRKGTSGISNGRRRMGINRWADSTPVHNSSAGYTFMIMLSLLSGSRGAAAVAIFIRL